MRFIELLVRYIELLYRFIELLYRLSNCYCGFNYSDIIRYIEIIIQ